MVRRFIITPVRRLYCGEGVLLPPNCVVGMGAPTGYPQLGEILMEPHRLKDDDEAVRAALSSLKTATGIPVTMYGTLLPDNRLQITQWVGLSLIHISEPTRL